MDFEGQFFGMEPATRVKETGIALVHEGEYIMPAPGSEAALEPAMASGGMVNYYFPVEIVIVGALSEQEREAIENRIWEKLHDALIS
jgi:hypothetical protein